MKINFKAKERINDDLIFEYSFYSTPNTLNKLEIVKADNFE